MKDISPVSIMKRRRGERPLLLHFYLKDFKKYYSKNLKTVCLTSSKLKGLAMQG